MTSFGDCVLGSLKAITETGLALFCIAASSHVASNTVQHLIELMPECGKGNIDNLARASNYLEHREGNPRVNGRLCISLKQPLTLVSPPPVVSFPSRPT